MSTTREMNVVGLTIAGLPNSQLGVVPEGDLRRLHLKGVDPEVHVVFAVDQHSMSGEEAMFEFAARLALGSRAHVTLFNPGDARQMCRDLLACARVTAELLERGERVLLGASATAGVELLAAAVLLEMGLSQPSAIGVVRQALPDALPDVHDEVTVAVIDELRESYLVRRTSRQPLGRQLVGAA
jgi:hypothetical protein